MTANIQLILAIVQFIIQLLKWMNKAEDPVARKPLVKAAKLVQFKAALQKAEEGDGSELEKMFEILKPVDRN